MKHLVLVVLAMALHLSAMATHVVGGSLTYEHLGGSTYRVTLKMYRDCSPGNAAFPNPVRIEVRDENGNSFSPDKDITINFPGATAVQPYIDTCAANPGLCLEEAIYTRVVTNLPPRVGGYHLFYQYCCRNSTIDNIVNPLGTGETWYAFIPNNASLITNSSPVWVNPPPVFVCQGQPMNFDHGATDSDGDSLVYSYYTPYNDVAPTWPGPVFSPSTWIGGFSANNPAGGPNLTMNSATGFITGAPPFVGQYVAGVKCEEYRNGVKIGEIIRDFQLNVVFVRHLHKQVLVHQMMHAQAVQSTSTTPVIRRTVITGISVMAQVFLIRQLSNGHHIPIRDSVRIWLRSSLTMELRAQTQPIKLWRYQALQPLLQFQVTVFALVSQSHSLIVLQSPAMRYSADITGNSVMEILR